MFEGPEFKSYIDFCRELRLERKWEDGDYYAVQYPGGVVVEMNGAFNGSYVDTPVDRPPYDLAWSSASEVWWLLLLHQWVDLIRLVGGLRNVRLYFPMTVKDDFVAKAYFADDRTVEGRAQGSVEEAAGRLWVAVTREIQKREGVR